MLIPESLSKIVYPFVRKFSGPYLLLLSIILGVGLGMMAPETAKSLEFMGRIYVDLLKLCVLPILFSAICVGTAQLVNIPNSRQLIFKLVVTLIGTQFIVGALALIVGLAFQPGVGISAKTLASLGGQINGSGINYEISLTGQSKIDATNPFLQLLSSTVPHNIFEAFAGSHSLQVVFFSILFGVSLGLLQEPSTNRIVKALEDVHTCFRMIIQWVTAILPLGLFSLISAQIAKTGFELIALMGKFVIITLVTFIVIYILNLVLLWLRSSDSFKTVWNASREYTTITMATSNSSAGMPSAICALTDKLKFDPQVVNAVLPIGIIAFRYGVVVYFTIATIFAAQLYNVHIGLNEGFLIIIGSMCGALASSGASGSAFLPALEIVFKLLALPLDSMLVLLIAVDPLLNPFRSTNNISMSMVVGSFIAPHQDEDDRVSERSWRVKSLF